MKIVGLMPARNEAWCLGLSARVALSWCDHLILYSHASDQAHHDVVHELILEYSPSGFNQPRRLTWFNDPTSKWDEMQHRQIMFDAARTEGATHVAIIDADEVLTGNLLGKINIREAVSIMPRGFILQLPGYNLRGNLHRYHNNGIWGNRWFSVAFIDDPALHWGGDKFHSREPSGIDFRNYQPISQGQGGVMHLWGVSERRLKAKHALYKITERLRWPDKRVEEIDQMYSWAIHGEGRNRSYGSPETWAYSEVPDAWWASYADLMQYLDVDAIPWQEAECKRLIDEYGPEPFSRLDLFGVV